MFDNGGGDVTVGAVQATTTQNTGLSVEYWADRALERIVYVAEDSDSVIKQQALAFRESIRDVLIQYMTNAIKSDRTTLYNLLLSQGETDMAEILRRL